MSRSRIAALLALTLTFASIGAGPLRAQTDTNWAAGDRVPPHDSLSIASRILGERRTINVHLPAGYAKGRRAYPVLYMPDGGVQEDFPHVVNTVDSLAALGAIAPVIVVGIENIERRRDLTGPTTVHADSAIAPHVGGSAAFRGFIRDELIPTIERRYRTTRDRAIVGESLAGLFVVETYLLEPSLFARYVALDPSLGWNANAAVRTAQARIDALGGARRTLFLASSSVAEIAEPTTRLAALLRATPPRDLTLYFEPRPDLRHDNIYRVQGPAALAAVLW